MQLGVVFPQTELGGDVGAVRQYGQPVEQQGYRHLLAYDHVVGADPEVHAPWDGPYDVDTTFHEPFVLFGFLAGITSLELVSGVIILPQRQTALVAKQAAEVDLLTGGRFRLGVGVGWNRVEFDALDQDFTTRGAGRTHAGVVDTAHGRRDRRRRAGRRRRPRSPAGAAADPGVVRLLVPTGASPRGTPRRRLVPAGPTRRRPGRGAREIVETAARDAGRDPSALGMEGRVSHRGDVDETVAAIGRWHAAGATHLSINTMGAGLTSVDEHIAALDAIATAPR